MLAISLDSESDSFHDVESVVQHYAYSAFGKILSIKDGNDNDVTDAPTIAPYFTYTGREWDAESNLYYYRARYYDSSIGRFIQIDPYPGHVSSPITIVNGYAGLGNNPTNMVDPDGRLFGIFKVGELITKVGNQLNRSLNDVTIGLFGKNNILTGALTELIVGNFGVTGLTFLNTSGVIDNTDARRINRALITAGLVAIGSQYLAGEAFSYGGYSLTGFEIAAGASAGGAIFSQVSNGGNFVDNALTATGDSFGDALIFQGGRSLFPNYVNQVGYLEKASTAIELLIPIFKKK